MLSYLKTALRSYLIRKKHPELQSGRIIGFDVVKNLNDALCRGGAIEDPLASIGGREIGYTGTREELSNIFDGVELGTWATDSRTIDWLWDSLSRNRPNAILEFGSGSSTCLFCEWMKRHNPSGIVISVEQSRAESEKTSRRLHEHGMSGNGRVVFMDVDSAGRIVVDCEKIAALLNGRKVDMLFVDGPAGPSGCRENTFCDSMPLFSASGHWFIHDAYRTGELNAIARWSSIDGVSVTGILCCGNGLGTGQWQLPSLS